MNCICKFEKDCSNKINNKCEKCCNYQLPRQDYYKSSDKVKQALHDSLKRNKTLMEMLAKD